MLKPWREVIVPHKDVAEGKYQQAEFAADLAQVLSKKADPEYQDASEFFSRTFLTEGMKLLLASSLRRACEVNGEPVIQLKTAFGGGKTHTMLALYHMFTDQKVHSHETVKSVLEYAKIDKIPKTSVAVLVGTDIDAAKPRTIPGFKHKINTLWGYMAYQLGKEEGYEFVKEADQHGVAPGADTLVQMFNRFGPCIILIDELVAYARNIYNKDGLPGGSFESLMSFVQSLTEATKRSKNSLVVAAIPESNIEIGGEGGEAALIRIENTFGRLEAIWKPVKPNESFEIVRRRLFEPVKDEKDKDEVCKAFSRMYSQSGADFPNECKETAYLERMRESYPLHPEIFDRLYSDWSTLEKFQRTRGVLRLMAATIHELWVRDDKSLMIMPGSIPLESSTVKNELTRYLPDEWNGIVDTDIDGDSSEPKKLDAANKRYGMYSAARRVARTVFLGSAPSSKEQKIRGIESVRIMLGVAQPGEQLATFPDALSSLSQKLTYLYSQGNRYWYDSRANLRKTVEDRAGKLEVEEVQSELNKRLHALREKADFSGVHICSNSEDIPDDDEARLVVIPPSKPHKKSSQLSPAYVEAKNILETRGNIPRQYKNMLLFVAADETIISMLENDVKHYLAWNSVLNDQEALNLDAHQRRQATDSVQKLDQTANIRLNEAYCWLLVPMQDGTNPIKIEPTKITKGDGNFIQRASKQLRKDELLITKWSAILLKNELDKWLWKKENHISLKKIWECFASYPYLPRLKDSSVLTECIQEGLRSMDFFGYATAVDESSAKYMGLEFGNPGARITIDSMSILIKKEIAQQQIQKEQADNQIPPTEPSTTLEETPTLTTQQTFGGKKQVNHRFNGIVELEPERLSRDVGQLTEEIIQHLAILPSSKIKVSLEINAEVPNGIPEKTSRIVLENSKTLKFKVHDFEE